MGALTMHRPTAQRWPQGCPTIGAMTTLPAPPELRQMALQAWSAADLERKLPLAQAFAALAATTFIATALTIVAPSDLPGSPDRPELRSHLDVPKRSPFTPEGLAALLHAVAHIEFNAINLALDAVWRFADMPPDYYRDWARVALEEATHFNLLRGLPRSPRSPSRTSRWHPMHSGAG